MSDIMLYEMLFKKQDLPVKLHAESPLFLNEIDSHVSVSLLNILIGPWRIGRRYYGAIKPRSMEIGILRPM